MVLLSRGNGPRKRQPPECSDGSWAIHRDARWPAVGMVLLSRGNGPKKRQPPECSDTSGRLHDAAEAALGSNWLGGDRGRRSPSSMGSDEPREPWLASVVRSDSSRRSSSKRWSVPEVSDPSRRTAAGPTDAADPRRSIFPGLPARTFPGLPARTFPGLPARAFPGLPAPAFRGLPASAPSGFAEAAGMPNRSRTDGPEDARSGRRKRSGAGRRPAGREIGHDGGPPGPGVRPGAVDRQ